MLWAEPDNHMLVLLDTDIGLATDLAVSADYRSAAERCMAVSVLVTVGVNMPIPVPVSSFSFGGWKASPSCDTHVHGPEGIACHTCGKVVTSRWPAPPKPDRPRLPPDAVTCAS
jgi:acyl-CoA reductase-like NAD-dependent aldehyde dehydrogenase